MSKYLDELQKLVSKQKRDEFLKNRIQDELKTQKQVLNPDENNNFNTPQR